MGMFFCMMRRVVEIMQNAANQESSASSDINNPTGSINQRQVINCQVFFNIFFLTVITHPTQFGGLTWIGNSAFGHQLCQQDAK